MTRKRKFTFLIFNLTRPAQEQGQVLVLILLVLVVSLTIGLSIAGRSLQNVEQGAATEEANRAFSAAEAGIEEALLDLQLGQPINIENPALEGGGTIKEVSPSVMRPISEEQALVIALKKDDVVQIALKDDDDDASGAINIKWEAPASLVIGRIYEDGGNYGVQKYAYNSTVQNSGNGFALWSGGGVSINADEGGKNGLALRIRAMYNDTKVRVWGGADMPEQGVIIDSVGQSGESERKVRVVRTLPALPAIFDYVLFSGGSITK